MKITPAKRTSFVGLDFILCKCEKCNYETYVNPTDPDSWRCLCSHARAFLMELIKQREQTAQKMLARTQGARDTNQAIEGDLPRPTGRLRCTRVTIVKKVPVIVTPDTAADERPVPGEWPEDETAAAVLKGFNVA
jgi:hypothetical protein